MRSCKVDNILCTPSDQYYLSQICLNTDVSMYKNRLYTCNILTSNSDRREYINYLLTVRPHVINTEVNWVSLSGWAQVLPMPPHFTDINKLGKKYFRCIIYNYNILQFLHSGIHHNVHHKKSHTGMVYWLSVVWWPS